MPGPGGILGFLEDQQQAQQPQANLSDIGAQMPPYFGGLANIGMMQPNGQVSAASAPPPASLSQYFDQFGQPKLQDPRQVAAQSGISLGQLAGGLFPSGGMGDIKYNVPSDQGGFFSIQDLFGLSGSPSLAPAMGPESARGNGNDQQVVRNGAIPTPTIGTFGQQLPSTNNWRLLGMGPGWIMRNGQLINTRDTGAVSHGLWEGGAPSGGTTGEQSIPGGGGVSLGTGASYGRPNMYAIGGPAMAGWPGALNWSQVFGGNV